MKINERNEVKLNKNKLPKYTYWSSNKLVQKSYFKYNDQNQIILSLTIQKNKEQYDGIKIDCRFFKYSTNKLEVFIYFAENSEDISFYKEEKRLPI